MISQLQVRCIYSTNKSVQGYKLVTRKGKCTNFSPAGIAACKVLQAYGPIMQSIIAACKEFRVGSKVGMS